MAPSEPVRDAWSPDAYARDARFVSDLGAPLIGRLAPRPGERILDLGCGDGALAARIAAAGAEVVGLDASPAMVAATAARGLDARLGDAAALPFDGEFDAVFSNAALHWVPDRAAVLAGVARALRPGGRFVGEFGGQGNVAAVRVAITAVLARDHGIETDLSEIWTFPTDAAYARELADHGFAVEEIALVPRPTPVPAGLAAWVETLAAPVLARLPETARAPAAREIARLAAPALVDEDGTARVDYVRLRFAARRP